MQPLIRIDVEHDGGDSALGHRSDQAAAAPSGSDLPRPPQSGFGAYARIRTPARDRAEIGRTAPAQGDFDHLLRDLGTDAFAGVIDEFAHHRSQRATHSLRQPAHVIRIKNAVDASLVDGNHFKVPAESEQVETHIDFSPPRRKPSGGPPGVVSARGRLPTLSRRNRGNINRFRDRSVLGCSTVHCYSPSLDVHAYTAC